MFIFQTVYCKQQQKQTNITTDFSIIFDRTLFQSHLAKSTIFLTPIVFLPYKHGTPVDVTSSTI